MAALLVVGSAPCLYRDVEQALNLFPTADVMLVNGACTALKFADHILAGHTDKAEEFQAARKKAFPDAMPWRLHATRFVKSTPRDKFPSVTDWHGPEMASGATSAGKAALIGLALGYEPIVLCGCPMDGSGYFPGESEGIKQTASCQRVGDEKKQQAGLIRRYREQMQKLAQTTFKGRVFSMSGFTRQVLGAPC